MTAAPPRCLLQAIGARRRPRGVGHLGRRGADVACNTTRGWRHATNRVSSGEARSQVTARHRGGPRREEVLMFLIWLLAVVIGIAGIVSLFRGQILLGIILIILAFVVGPGGYSIFK